MKKLITIAVMSALIVGCNQEKVEKEAAPAKPVTDVEKQSYALGAMFSSRLAKDTGEMGEGTLNHEMLKQGFSDGLEDKSVFTQEEIQQQVAALQQSMQKLMQEKRDNELVKNKAEGKEHIEKLKTEDKDVQASESNSGLYFKVLEEGDKENYPKATDMVKVHYTGSFIDGTEFESTKTSGTPAEFPLNRVIPGWTEGLQLMSQGAKYRFYIPSELAYGDQGSRGTIPPGATLIFDIELLDINPEKEEAEEDEHAHAENGEEKTEAKQ